MTGPLETRCRSCDSPYCPECDGPSRCRRCDGAADSTYQCATCCKCFCWDCSPESFVCRYCKSALCLLCTERTIGSAFPYTCRLCSMTGEQRRQEHEDRVRRAQLLSEARMLWPGMKESDLETTQWCVEATDDGLNWARVEGSECPEMVEAVKHRNRLIAHLTAEARASGMGYRVRPVIEQPTLPMEGDR